jgi:biotin-dependent carboxylase-like uncharacterized protein
MGLRWQKQAQRRDRRVRAGWHVHIKKKSNGNWAYLATAGGFETDSMLGSHSTYLRGRLGNVIHAGDVINIGKPSNELGKLAARDYPVEKHVAYSQSPVIEVIAGPQKDRFTNEGFQTFLNSEYSLSTSFDRMGYRLEGPVLRHLHGHNIVSDGTVNGSLQVPGNGQPIVLMRDRGTSGGYPKIAAVISADFGRFAQIPAGRAFRFQAVSMAEAQAEARKFAALLRTLPERLRSIESVDLNIDALHDANVAGHAVSAVDAGTWHAVTPADIAGPD